MCQIYLDLPSENRTWCQSADEKVCEELIQYVMCCGDFGRKREILQSGSASQFPTIRHPIQLFKYIQFHGERNWKAVIKHPYLKPFAWVYQFSCYIKIVGSNRFGIKKIKSVFDEGKKRNEMFVTLGIK